MFQRIISPTMTDHAHSLLGWPQPEWAAGKQGARATGSVVPTCAEESAHEYRVRELDDQNDATKTGLKGLDNRLYRRSHIRKSRGISKDLLGPRLPSVATTVESVVGRGSGSRGSAIMILRPIRRHAVQDHGLAPRVAKVKQYLALQFTRLEDAKGANWMHSTSIQRSSKP